MTLTLWSPISYFVFCSQTPILPCSYFSATGWESTHLPSPNLEASLALAPVESWPCPITLERLWPLLSKVHFFPWALDPSPFSSLGFFIIAPSGGTLFSGTPLPQLQDGTAVKPWGFGAPPTRTSRLRGLRVRVVRPLLLETRSCGHAGCLLRALPGRGPGKCWGQSSPCRPRCHCHRI